MKGLEKGGVIVRKAEFILAYRQCNGCYANATFVPYSIKS